MDIPVIVIMLMPFKLKVPTILGSIRGIHSPAAHLALLLAQPLQEIVRVFYFITPPILSAHTMAWGWLGVLTHPIVVITPLF